MSMLGQLVATGVGLFSNYAQNTISPQRKIGEISGFIVTEESSVDELEITEHPVQSGAAITDHAYKKPAEISIRFICGQTAGDLQTVYDELLQLQEKRELFSVTTGKRTYNDMLLKALSVTTDKTTENILSVSADFKQVILVELQTTTLPPKERQKKPQTTQSTAAVGTKGVSKVNAQQSAQLERSALFSIAGS